MNTHLLANVMSLVHGVVAQVHSYNVSCYCKNGGAINRLYTECKELKGLMANHNNDNGIPSRFKVKILANAELPGDERICYFCFRKITESRDLLELLQTNDSILQCYFFCTDEVLQKNKSFDRRALNISVSRKSMGFFNDKNMSIFQTYSGKEIVSRENNTLDVRVFFRMEKDGFEVLTERFRRLKHNINADVVISPGKNNKKVHFSPDTKPPSSPLFSEENRQVSSSDEGIERTNDFVELIVPEKSSELDNGSKTESLNSVTDETAALREMQLRNKAGQKKTSNMPIIFMILFVFIPLAGIIVYFLWIQYKKRRLARITE